MSTIKNSMERRIANSRNISRQSIINSILIGATGYFVFLFTLATTYWFTSKPFRYGLTHIDEKDLLLSSIGFFVLFTTYLAKDIKK